MAEKWPLRTEALREAKKSPPVIRPATDNEHYNALVVQYFSRIPWLRDLNPLYAADESESWVYGSVLFNAAYIPKGEGQRGEYDPKVRVEEMDITPEELRSIMQPHSPETRAHYDTAALYVHQGHTFVHTMVDLLEMTFGTPEGFKALEKEFYEEVARRILE
jgi:hypothetical protein